MPGQPIGSSDGKQYSNRLDFFKQAFPGELEPSDDVDENMVKTPSEVMTGKKLDNAELDPSTGLGIEASYKTPAIDDRRDESLGSMLKGWVGDQFTLEKMHAVLSHPTATPMQRAGYMSADEPVKSTPLGEDAGLSDIGFKPDPSKIDASRLTDIHRGGPPVPMPEVIAKTKAGDITNEDIDSAINVGLSAGPGTIGGTYAKGVDKTALYQARRMDMEGAHPDTIWDQTGWFKGADNRWKFEIKDADATINHGQLQMTDFSKGQQKINPDAEAWYQVPSVKKDFFGKQTNPLYLKDFLDHPELYKQYPQLQDVKVVPTPGLMSLSGVKGYMDAAGKELALSPDTLKNMRSTALHEVQHGIQAIEGFSTGANTDVFKSDRWKDLEKGFSTFKDTVKDYTTKNYGKNFFDDVRDAITREDSGLVDLRMRAADGSKYAQGQLKMIEDTIQQARDAGVYDHIKKTLVGDGIVKKYDAELFNAYKNVKGEVEARNVQNRLDPKVYKLNPDQAEPWFTDAGIALDTTYGAGNKNNTYGLRKWGTKEAVDPESLSPELKAVWDNINYGRTKSQMRPTITEDVPRELQTWSPWDSKSLRDLYD